MADPYSFDETDPEAGEALPSVYALETAEMVLQGAPESLEDIEAAAARRRVQAAVAASILVQADGAGDLSAQVARRLGVSIDEAEELLAAPDTQNAARAMAARLALSVASFAQKKWVSGMTSLEELAADGGVDSAVRVRAASSLTERAEKMLGMIAAGAPKDPNASTSQQTTVVVQSGFVCPPTPELPPGGVGLSKKV